MLVRILGAAAGGGLPQWNCGCRNCQDARAGVIPSSGQSSLAVSADGRSWAILNASPDLRVQLSQVPELAPQGLRGSPVASVLVTNGDIDHVVGLLSLREATPFTLFATKAIHEVLAQNPIFGAVNPDLVPRRAIEVGQPFALLPGLQATVVPVPGKVPLYLEGDVVETDLIGEQTVGLRLEAGGKVLWYIPGCAHVPDDLLARLSEADALFFDGTLWDDEEMIRMGAGVKTGRRMGHMPVSGADGSMARLSGLRARKVFIHMNNTNPLWQPDGPERTEAARAGWAVGADGMEMEV
jgi:pyrroloquinoline quinone biosynthesis protein B